MANKRRSKFERFKLVLLVIRALARLKQVVFPFGDVVAPWVLDCFDQIAIWSAEIIEALKDFDIW
jgi:hypothetical protein